MLISFKLLTNQYINLHVSYLQEKFKQYKLYQCWHDNVEQVFGNWIKVMEVRR